MNFEKRANSKAFLFFDRLFRLFICNVLVIISMIVPVSILLWILISLGAGGNIDILLPLIWIDIASFIITFPFLILPSLVASTRIIKKGNEVGIVFKEWFRYFADYYVKSMLIGLIFSTIVGIVIFGLYFYSNVEIVEQGITVGNFVFTKNMQNIVMQAGFVVMMVIILIIILLLVHIPLLVITFPKLKVVDLIKTDIFVTINNFISTLILLVMVIVSVGLFALFPIWIIFGISLPIMVGVRLTKVSYNQLEKVDFDKINTIIDEEEKLEKEEEKIG